MRIDMFNAPLIPSQDGIHIAPKFCLEVDPVLRRGERFLGKLLFGALFAVLLTGCGQVESEAQLPNVAGKVATPASPPNHDVFKHGTKPKIDCTGIAEQGGLVLCQTSPNAEVKISRGGDDSFTAKADGQGQILVGFDRDETHAVIFVDGVGFTHDFEKRKYAISRIDGLPPSQVSTFTEAQLKRIRASSVRKKKGFASRQQTLWFKDGFDYPLKKFKKTSPFGAQRILNGVKKKPHYGVDIAAPVGTPIYAPADGVVSLADDELYFEGAMVLLDHGQGLISMYLHVSKIDVKPGQVVKRGEKIAEVGSRGRSTGPHLCWRLKWRNRNLDPELLTKWPKQEAHKHE